jgi:hypothetical protein
MTGRAYERELLVELGNIANELKMTRLDNNELFAILMETFDAIDCSLEHFVAISQEEE